MGILRRLDHHLVAVRPRLGDPVREAQATDPVLHRNLALEQSTRPATHLQRHDPVRRARDRHVDDKGFAGLGAQRHRDLRDLEISLLRSTHEAVIERRPLGDKLSGHPRERLGAIAVGEYENPVMAPGIHPRERFMQCEPSPRHVAISRVDRGLRIAHRDELVRVVEEMESVGVARTRSLQEGAPFLFPGIHEILRRARTIEQHPEIDAARFQDHPRITQDHRNQQQQRRPQRPPELQSAKEPADEHQKREEKKELGRYECHPLAKTLSVEEPANRERGIFAGNRSFPQALLKNSAQRVADRKRYTKSRCH